MAMPRFDRLRLAFSDDERFGEILGYFYKSMLDFHCKAYRYLTRSGLKAFSDSLWRSSSNRFTSMIQTLKKYQELVDTEANANSIIEAAKDRQAAKAHRVEILNAIQRWETLEADRLRKFEKELADKQYQDAKTWVAANDVFDEEQHITHVNRLEDDSEEFWAPQEHPINEWLSPSEKAILVWLHGKPGAGKSMLCSQLIEHIRAKNNVQVAFCFCKQRQGIHYRLNEVLKSLVMQLLHLDQTLVPVLVDEYYKKGLKPTTKHLENIFALQLNLIPNVRLIVDGVDEIEDIDDRRAILRFLLKYKIPKNSSSSVKILVSSRQLHDITGSMRSVLEFSLEKHRAHISRAVLSFLKSRHKVFANIRSQFGEALASTSEKALFQRANGMFLWVRLIIDVMDQLQRECDIIALLETIPDDLYPVYDNIVTHLCREGRQPNQQAAIRVFQWLSAAKRPLRRSELEVAIVLDNHNLNITEKTRHRQNVLDYCIPLVDATAGEADLVQMIHFTALEYIRRGSVFSYLAPSSCNNTVFMSLCQCLRSAYLLLGSSMTLYEKNLAIMRGQFDLLNYALEHFTSHLQNFLVEGFEALAGYQRRDYAYMVVRLGEAHAMVAHNQTPCSCEGSTEKRSDLLRNITRHATLSKKCQDFLWHASHHCNGSTDDRASHRLRHDDDPGESPRAFLRFAQLGKTYRVALEELLSSSDTLSSFDSKLVSAFKARHGRGAFLCRFPACERASLGFDDAATRCKHESTHCTEYRCSEPGCEAADWPFKSSQALKKHVREMHQERLVSMQKLMPTSREWPSSDVHHRNLYSETQLTPTSPEWQSSDVHNRNLYLETGHEPVDVLEGFDFDAFLKGGHDFLPESAGPDPNDGLEEFDFTGYMQAANASADGFKPNSDLKEGHHDKIRDDEDGDFFNMSLDEFNARAKDGREPERLAFETEHNEHPPPMETESSIDDSTVQGKKSMFSSAWSDDEMQNFIVFLSHYGTDWAALARALGTKSETMVKEYYHRAEPNSEPPLGMLAELGDDRRQREHNAAAAQKMAELGQATSRLRSGTRS